MDRSADSQPPLAQEPYFHPAQLAAYRRMSPEEKLRQWAGLYRQAKVLKRAWLQQQHPEWTSEQLDQAILGYMRRVRSE